jgi:hypothetical protein
MIGHRWKEKKHNLHTETMLKHLAALVRRKQARLLLIDDVPEISETNPLLCDKRPWRPFPSAGCLRGQAIVDQDQHPYDELAERIKQDYPNVVYLKLRQLYCVDQSCGPYKGDLIIYRDTDHLTLEASQLGAQRIAKALTDPAPDTTGMDSSPSALPRHHSGAPTSPTLKSASLH